MLTQRFHLEAPCCTAADGYAMMPQDIKSPNVLLGVDYTAKIAVCCLAMLLLTSFPRQDDCQRPQGALPSKLTYAGVRSAEALLLI